VRACRAVVGQRFAHLRITRDDGATWTSVRFGPLVGPSPRSYVSAIFVADTGEIYVGGAASDYGEDGTLLRRASP